MAQKKTRVHTEVGRTLAANLRSLRERRGLSLTDTERKLAEVGHELARTAIGKIETLERRADADDIMALAVVLNVTPARLLLPDDYSGRPFQIAPDRTVPTLWLWEWAMGRMSLDMENTELTQDERFLADDAYQDEQPTALKRLARHTLSNALRPVDTCVRRLVRETCTETGDKTFDRERVVASAKRFLRLLNEQLDAHAGEEG